jgi:hypothetical protein
MNKKVRFWRGTRESYNLLQRANKLDYWMRYSVKEINGSWTEYFGSNQISCPSGQVLPVIDIVEKLPNLLNPGDRYLVGVDQTELQPCEYYIVTIDVDTSNNNSLSARVETLHNNSGISVRVINKKSMAYQLVDGYITTYDLVDGGTF